MLKYRWLLPAYFFRRHLLATLMDDTNAPENNRGTRAGLAFVVSPAPPPLCLALPLAA